MARRLNKYNLSQNDMSEFFLNNMDEKIVLNKDKNCDEYISIRDELSDSIIVGRNLELLIQIVSLFTE